MRCPRKIITILSSFWSKTAILRIQSQYIVFESASANTFRSFDPGLLSQSQRGVLAECIWFHFFYLWSKFVLYMIQFFHCGALAKRWSRLLYRKFKEVYKVYLQSAFDVVFSLLDQDYYHNNLKLAWCSCKVHMLTHY